MNVKDLREKEAIREIKLDSESHYQIQDKIILNVANNPSIRTWVSRLERLRGEPLTR